MILLLLLCCVVSIATTCFKSSVSCKLEKLHELVMIAYVIITLFFVYRTNEVNGVRNTSKRVHPPNLSTNQLLSWTNQWKTLPAAGEELNRQIRVDVGNYNDWSDVPFDRNDRCNFTMPIHDWKRSTLPLTSQQHLLPRDEKTLLIWQSISGQ